MNSRKSFGILLSACIAPLLLVGALRAWAGTIETDSMVVYSNTTLYGDLSFGSTNIVCPTNGLILYYSFNTNQGAIVHDDSGNGNTGVVYGATWTENGQVGGAYLFSGGTNYISMDSLALSMSSTNSFSIATWFYADDFHTEDGNLIVGVAAPYGSGYGTFCYCLVTGSARDWGYSTNEDLIGFSMGAYCDQNSDGPCMLGAKEKQWYHVAGVFDAGTARIYVDGKYQGEEPYSLGYTPAPDSILASIGGGGQCGFYGTIDELMVFNRALSASEVLEIYFSAKGVFVGNARFEKGISYVAPNGDLLMGSYTNQP